MSKISTTNNHEDNKQINKPNNQTNRRQNATSSKSFTKFPPGSAPDVGNNHKNQRKQTANYNNNYRRPQRNERHNRMPAYPRDKEESLLSPREGKKGKNRVATQDLIKFRFQARDSASNNDYGSVRPRPKQKGNVFSKNQSLQAKWQVVFRSGKDYSLHLADPDALFEWEDIEKINVWSYEIPSCPICLHEASAAHITPCGHIYCWSCILRFLHQNNKAWGCCPVCTDKVHANELRSVGVYKEEEHGVKSTLSMRLMRRSKDSATPMPVERLDDGQLVDSAIEPVYIKDQFYRNFRYLVATPEQIMADVIMKDMDQLQFELAVETDDLEKPFIQMAIQACQQRKTLMEALIAKRQKRAKEKEEKTKQQKEQEGNDVTTTSSDDDTNNKQDDVIKHDDDDVTNIGDVSNSMAALTTDETPSSSTDVPDTNYFYFYQASDGQHIYMSQLNTRCLTHQYGNYQQLPLNIEANIVQLDQYTMDELTRRQHKYMSHLPLSLKFQMAELDLKPLLTDETLTFFKKSLDSRVEARRKRNKEEERIQKRARLEAMRKAGKYPPARYQLNSKKQFPGISGPATHSVLLRDPSNVGYEDEYIPPPSLLEPSTSSHNNTTTSIEVSASSSSTSSNNSVFLQPQSSSSTESTPSFAQMLRSPNQHGGGERTTPVWGRTRTTSYHKPTPSTNNTAINNHPDDEDFDPDYVPPPSFQSSFVDALWKDPVKVSSPEQAAGSGKKKKKKGGNKKKQVLFSTGSCY